MSEELLDFSEALAAAEAEMGLGESFSAVEETDSPVDETVPADSDKQAETEVDIEQPAGEAPAEDDEDLIESFDDLDVPESTSEAIEPGSPQWWDQAVDVPTQGTVTLAEMRDGYLRQSDYTQKTQDLADQRKALAQARDFFESFENNPEGFARALAERAGLIEAGQGPVVEIELAPFRTEAEVEAEIEKRVTERLNSDPNVLQAQVAAARQQVAAEFDRVEKALDVKLGDTARQQIIDEAARREVYDLELVTQALLAKQRKAAAARGTVKRAAPTRTRSTPEVGDDMNLNKVPDDVQDAVAMALAELGS